MRILFFLIPVLCLFNSNIAHTQNENIDLELQFSTITNDVPLYTKTPFTLTIINKGESTATNIQIQFSVQKPGVVFVGEVPIATSNGFYRAHGDQVWEIASLAPQENATLDLQLFFLETPGLFAEVIAVDQEDIDSTPNNGRQSEDDETAFPIVSDCSFFAQYEFDPPFLSEVFDDLSKGIELAETDELYQIAGNDFDQFGNLNATYTLAIDKNGKLDDFLVEVQAVPNPATASVREGNIVQLIKLDDNHQDTLFNRFIEVDYPDPTAVVINSFAQAVSDGYIFGGFIVDVEGDQMFTGFLVKTDLNGENAQTMLIPDIDDTLGFREIMEDENGRLFIFWAAAGNFTITGTNAEFTSTWARQFASDTPSTRLNNLKLSADGSKIFLGITDNLRAEVIAYNAETGENVEGGFEVFNTFPYDGDFRFTVMSGFLPLPNGNLLASFSYSEAGRTSDGYGYGLVDRNGELIWSKDVAGESLNLVPVAQTNDGGFLLFGYNTPREFVGLTALKINFDGSQTPSCEEENRIAPVSTVQSISTAKLFPNPASDWLHLSINSIEEAEKEIQIFDLQGRLVWNKQQLLFEGRNLLELEINTLESGIYFIRIGGQAQQKFVKI